MGHVKDGERGPATLQRTALLEVRFHRAINRHARKLVQATDLQAMQIQSEFLKSQFTNAGQHMQQITNEIMSSAKDASKGKFQGLPSTAFQ
jgi:hypothetical protein